MQTPEQRIEISVAQQKLRLVGADGSVTEYPVSTSKFGLGTEEGSNRTPTGEFEVEEKIGADAPRGTIFKGRKPKGVWNPDEPTNDDLVLSRILWLRGKEEHNANSRDRFIYIHGTNQEELVGSPASHGCIRMRNQDVLDLFNRVAENTPVSIA